MKFSYNWLKELHPKIPKPEKAAELLTFHSFQVESVAKLGGDVKLDIAILPNRIADASGHIGVARELAVIQSQEFLVPPAYVKEDKALVARDLLSVAIRSKNLAPRYSARVLTNIKVGQSPDWMQKRLKVCGLRPINVIVDVTNYVMLETGQPLHAFDYDRLRQRAASGKKEIIVRMAKKGEIVETLGDDAEKLKLQDSDIVIADAKGAIALAGVKGGRGSEIHADTRRIVIESANFHPAAVRNTSRRIGLRTDASLRFEHGISPELTLTALDRAAGLLQQITGAVVAKGIIDVYPRQEPLRTVRFSVERAISLLGMKVEEAPAAAILKHLGCEMKKRDRGIFQVIPPAYRRDLAIEEDLIEEVGRILGYQRIAPVMPLIRAGIPKKSDRQIFEDALKDRLAGLGFTESHLSAFIGARELKPFGITSDSLYALQNPASPEAEYLLHLPALQYVRSMAENLRNVDGVKIFGISRGFLKTAKGPREWKSLFLGLAERGKNGKEEFYVLKGVVDALLESFGMAERLYDDASVHEMSWAHPYRAASIKVGDKSIGVIGELSHLIQDSLKSKARIIIAEFNVETLIEAMETEQEFRPIIKFPAVVRDLALVIPEDERIQEVENLIWSAAPKSLVDTDLFDYYEGDELPDGGKSVAFHLVFQSEERTLTDAEVSQELAKILEAVRAKGWEIRG